MTVLGIGTMELVLILLLMILIFGPDRINEMGRWLGQAYRRLTGITTEVNQQVMEVRKSMNAAVDLPNVTNPIKEMTREINQIGQNLTQPIQEAKANVQEIQHGLRSKVTMVPPAPLAAEPDLEEEE